MTRPAGGRMRPEEHYDLLVRAALGPLDGAGDALRRWRALEDLSDPDMGVLRLLPLLGDRVAELAPDDDLLRTKVAHFSRFAWLRGHLLLKGTAPGVRALIDAQIPVLLLKGAAIIQIPGVEQRLRMMDDLDLLVRPQDVPHACRVLMDAGFRARLPVADDDDVRRLLPGRHALPFGEQGGEIDLHWHALHARRHPDLDDAWWSAAVPTTYAGVETLACCPSDVLVQAIGHGSRWVEDAAPRWIADVAMLLRAAGDTIDWARVSDMAAAARLSGVVADALEYVDKATGVGAPTSAIASLRSAPVPLAERLRAHRRIDPRDGGPVPPGPVGRLAEAYEARVSVSVPPGTRTGPADTVRMLAREWSLPSARSVPAEAAFLAAGRPWPLRRLARRAAGAPARPVPSGRAYTIGDVVSFDAGGDGVPFLRGGWFEPEDFGIWSQGTPSVVVLPLPEPVDRDVELELQLIGFVTRRVAPLRLDLAVNDVCVARPTFTDPARPITIVRTVAPRRAVTGWNRLELTFVARHPVTPADARDGSDLRRLAIGLVKLGTG